MPFSARDRHSHFLGSVPGILAIKLRDLLRIFYGIYGFSDLALKNRNKHRMAPTWERLRKRSLVSQISHLEVFRTINCPDETKDLYPLHRWHLQVGKRGSHREKNPPLK